MVTRFTAEPGSVEPGGSVTLRWDVTGTGQVVIDHGIGMVAAHGATEVKPVTSTAYMLTATGTERRVSATAFVIVTSRASRLYDEAVSKRHGGRFAEAMMLYRQAADLGEPRAMVELGEGYRVGEGVPRSEEQAVAWFREGLRMLTTLLECSFWAPCIYWDLGLLRTTRLPGTKPSAVSGYPEKPCLPSTTPGRAAWP